MKNIILVTHGKFAIGIIDSLKIIYGNVENISYVSLEVSDQLSDIKDNIIKEIEKYENNISTIIITDIVGGSTTRAALETLSHRKNIYIITGLNLGLLLEIVMADIGEDDSKNKEILEDIISDTKETMYLVNNYLERNCQNLEEL